MKPLERCLAIYLTFHPKQCLAYENSIHTSCEDALKGKKISEQTTGQALFWTYFCIRICVEANDLATSKQGLVYITI